MLGLIGGALLAVLLYAFFQGSGKVRMVAVGSVVLALLLVGSLKLAKDTPFVKEVGFLDRLASISLSDRTIASRITNMTMAWEGVKERPLLGWGQENYAIVFDKYFDPQMYGNEPWFDRVHNSVFDWLVAGGFLVSYLSVFGVLLWTIWKKTGLTRAEQSIFTGLLAGYFFHNLTVFDNITSYILFGTVIAYIVFRTSEGERPLFGGALVRPSAAPVVALLAVPLVWGVALLVNADAYAQNKALIAAIKPQSDIQKNYEYFREAISYGSFGTQEAREQLAQITTRLAGADVPISTKQQFFELAVREMRAQADASPLDARFPLFLGLMYESYGDLKNGALELQKALSLSPKKQLIMFELGKNAWAQGDHKKALEYFRTAYELAPEFDEPAIYFVAAAIRAGEEPPQEVLRMLIQDGEVADDRILAAYGDRGELRKAIPLWKAHIETRPDDMQAYFTLAAIYYQTGDRTSSIGMLEEAKRLFPSVSAQADSLIKEVRAGTVRLQ